MAIPLSSLLPASVMPKPVRRVIVPIPPHPNYNPAQIPGRPPPMRFGGVTPTRAVLITGGPYVTIRDNYPPITFWQGLLGRGCSGPSCVPRLPADPERD